jgi:hypothetical protein
MALRIAVTLVPDVKKCQGTTSVKIIHLTKVAAEVSNDA